MGHQMSAEFYYQDLIVADQDQHQYNAYQLIRNLQLTNYLAGMQDQLVLEKKDVKKHYVTCEYCEQRNFENYRYQCLICSDYNLCSGCYDRRMTNLSHRIDHPMVRYEEPDRLNGERLDPSEVTYSNFKRKYAFEEHHGVRCNSCLEEPIIGLRFKCHTCKDYDLCMDCYEMGGITHWHKPSHPVIVQGEMSWKTSALERLVKLKMVYTCC